MLKFNQSIAKTENNYFKNTEIKQLQHHLIEEKSEDEEQFNFNQIENSKKCDLKPNMVDLEQSLDDKNINLRSSPKLLIEDHLEDLIN